MKNLSVFKTGSVLKCFNGFAFYFILTHLFFFQILELSNAWILILFAKLSSIFA